MGCAFTNNNSLDIAQGTTRANFYSTSKDSLPKNWLGQADFGQSTTIEFPDSSSWNLAPVKPSSNKFQINSKKSGLNSKNASISIVNTIKASLTQDVSQEPLTQGRPFHKPHQFSRLKDKNLLLNHG